MLIRAVGPKLADWGVPAVLADPQLLVRRKDGETWTEIAANDDWENNANLAELIDATGRVGAFELNPGGADAALLADLREGQYGVVASGADGETGVALVELYDAAPPAEGDTPARPKLVNISNRGYVGAAGEIMIPGFVVSDEGPKTFLVRAVGPGLSTWLPPSGLLTDPRLTVYRRLPGDPPTEEAILANDNWGENGDAVDVAEVAGMVGAFPLEPGSADAAFVITLAPGIYTIHASGADGGTGLALVELYLVE
jgi:hypothetical protein